MSKQVFISMVEKLIENNNSVDLEQNYAEGLAYFNNFKTAEIKPLLTENGKKIVAYLQKETEKGRGILTSSQIAEGLFVSGRVVSGAMRKLITDEIIIKTDSTPAVYELSDKGKEIDVNQV